MESPDVAYTQGEQRDGKRADGRLERNKVPSNQGGEKENKSREL
jgi:hypothetical protein